jgi:hypothetical protein
MHSILAWESQLYGSHFGTVTDGSWPAADLEIFPPGIDLKMIDATGSRTLKKKGGQPRPSPISRSKIMCENASMPIVG